MHHPDRQRSRQAPRIVLAAGLTGAMVAAGIATGDASSHREAPLITEDPVADNTDLYAFVSPDRPTHVSLISNFVPFQEPGGGPNYFQFGEDVLYEIHVDNDGDAVEDITYEFRFQDDILNPDTYLPATGPIASLSDATYNHRQTMRVFEVRDGQRTELTSGALTLPPSNIGPRSTPDYEALVEEAIYDIDSNKTVFAGQRDEGFYVDIASIFDLGGLRPFNSAHAIAPNDTQDGIDTFAGYNVHTIALQVPITELTQGDEPVIGVWTTTSRRQVRVFAEGSSANPQNRGQWVQVSRLGMPLVNEVVVPLEFKDVFNTLRPVQDADVFPALSAPNSTDGRDDDDQGSVEGGIPLVTDPILAEQIEALYGLELPPAPRNDLVSVFLTGVEGLNQPANVRPAEMLRLNTAIAPVAPGDDGYSALGVIAGDLGGFPNGRRVGDDIVDAALRVVGGVLVEGFNVAPNNALSDGVQSNDLPYLTTFPYLATPHQGYDLNNEDRVN